MKLAEGVVWKGPESLVPLLLPLSAVSAWPANPRQGDVGAVAASLARFGQQKPIVVQKSTGWIVAGNHTWRAAYPAHGEVEIDRTWRFEGWQLQRKPWRGGVKLKVEEPNRVHIDEPDYA